jgi:hypothetical protein
MDTGEGEVHGDKNQHPGHGEDDNYDEEYEKIHDQAGDVVTIIDEVRVALDEQLDLIRGRALSDLFNDHQDLDAVRATTKRAKRVLRGSGRFLVDDVTTSLQALRGSLAQYSKLVVDKLKEEFPAAEGKI